MRLHNEDGISLRISAALEIDLSDCVSGNESDRSSNYTKEQYHSGLAMKTMKLMAALVLFAVTGIGCTKGNLRGSFEISRDGKTYLTVADDNGGQCGPLKVDGKVWPHRIGEAGLIEPGHHRISCGGEIQFDIPNGVSFKFDYWGP